MSDESVQVTEAAPEAAPVAPEAPVAQDAQQAEKKPEDIQPKPLATASKAFAERAAREQKLREREIATQQQEANVRYAQELQHLAKNDPLEFLNRTGLTYDDFAKALAKPKDPMAPVMSKVQELEQKLAAKEQAEQNAYLDRAYQEAQSEVRKIIDTSDKYPLTKGAGAHGLVWEVIQKHYDRTGEIVSDDAAASEVEAYLDGFLGKLASIPQVQSRFAPPPPVLPSDGQPSQGMQPKTLTNQQSSTIPVRTSPGLLSAEESIERAAKLLRFTE